MSLVIYNSLTRKKEEFKSLQPGRVHIYVCGPTVYSHAHIGHAKSYVSFDVIVRYFRYKGFNVKYVQNITDVGHLTDDADEGEDKIIKKAREEHVDPMEIAEYFAWSYFDDMRHLGVLRANIFPRASGHIPEQIELVQKLLDKGYAYEVNGSVYYDVSKFRGYGKLSGRKVEDLEAGARVGVNPEKRHPGDFALWKKAEPGHLMHWHSPWGEGYPGWHIECSAMSMKYLGDTFDIHGGGLDNIFPHHECEIAQSEAATGKQFVRYWMHNNMVTVDGLKMSKSTGNFVTIKDALKKYSMPSIRYFILSSHYRSPLDISDEALTAAETGSAKLIAAIRTVALSAEKAGNISDFKAPFQPDEYRARFEAAMDDDFNTPRAVAVLFDLVRESNAYVNSGQNFDQSFLKSIEKLYLDTAGMVLGLVTEDMLKDHNGQSLGDVEKIIQLTVEIRKHLREKKQFELADDIRSRLGRIGITLTDKPEGTTWEYNPE
jgi:cysteinyl-tRNA synthetase